MDDRTQEIKIKYMCLHTTYPGQSTNTCRYKPRIKSGEKVKFAEHFQEATRLVSKTKIFLSLQRFCHLGRHPSQRQPRQALEQPRPASVASKLLLACFAARGVTEQSQLLANSPPYDPPMMSVIPPTTHYADMH